MINNTATKIIIITCFLINIVDSHSSHIFIKNHILNIQKSIYLKCNKYAMEKTNNKKIYDCIINKNNSCHLIDNYNEYNLIKNECIKTYRNECNLGILITLMMWIIFAICGKTDRNNIRY